MKGKFSRAHCRSGLVLVLLLMSCSPLVAASISYQGQLKNGGSPYTGLADLSFALYDQVQGGSQIGTTQNRLNWPVSDGLFQVELDFGPGAFDGSARFLEVRVNGSALSPRQAVTATPVALFALGGNPGPEGPPGPPGPPGDPGPDGWRLDGNAGTDSATHFIGTTDNQALELRTRNTRNLRLQSSATLFNGIPVTANVIAGSHANEVSPGAQGATIAGGGAPAGSNFVNPSAAPNRVVSHFSTVGGGFANLAGASGGRNFATVGGGQLNTASGWRSTISGGSNNSASGRASTIGGGEDNTNTGFWSTVGGGIENTASGTNSVVAGGSGNTASGSRSVVAGGGGNTASGSRSTIGGGELNCAGGFWSWAGGHRAKVRPTTDPLQGSCSGLNYPGGQGDQGTFVWADSQDADFVSTGSNQFLIRASGGMGINTTSPSAALQVAGSLIAGAGNNLAPGANAVVTGGLDNQAIGANSLVAGRGARALHDGSIVLADGSETLFESTADNQFLVRASGGAGFGRAPQDYFEIFSGQDETSGAFGFGDGALRVTLGDGSGGVATRFRVLGNGGVAVGSGYNGTGVPDRGLRVFGEVQLDNLGNEGGSSLCRNSENRISDCSSSRRYKQDIELLEGDEALRLINALRTVRYQWISSGRADIGLVAEEVAEIVPEIVTYNADGQVEGFEYNRLGPLLVAGLQAQADASQARFAELAAENAELRAKLSVLMIQSGKLRELADRNAELERRLELTERGQLEKADLARRLAALESLLVETGPLLVGKQVE